MNLTQKKSNMIQKVILSFITIFILSFGLSNVIGIEMADTAEATLKSQIKANNQDKLEATIDKAGKEVVNTAREIAIVALVVLIIWMAYSLLIKKSAEGLADMKGRLGGVVIAVAFIFFTDQILGAIFGVLGVKL
ncbi:hypothetical protein [Psychrobacillus sp. FSL H8-0487]|uniref:hypothetical protein n=1 Tax=Psychrobacillus sp. FSL H8-0487 TaxID=2921391 RepID=UPI0030FD113C